MSSTAVPDEDGTKITGTQLEVDDSLIPISAPTATEADEGDDEGVEEDAEEDALDGPPDLAQLSAPKKKKRKNKSAASRGPTALPKNRGNGFEGMVSHFSELIKMFRY